MLPYFIEQRLELRNQIYSETTAYGHIGRQNEIVTKEFTDRNGQKASEKLELFIWEKLDFL